jgi:hypothetical protein
LTACEGNFVEGKMKLNVKGLKKGIYYLHVKIEDKIYKEQILIE